MAKDFETRVDRLRVHFITEAGRVKTIIVIQYEAYIDGRWRPIVRFDEAHGFFHRELVSPTGEQEKTYRSATDKGIALNETIAEIKQQWRSYRKAYEDQYYGRDTSN